jgi:uncharacterized protein YaeQ
METSQGSVEVWRWLLVLSPSNRRAQDALKKLLVDLGQYDEPRIFSASGTCGSSSAFTYKQVESKLKRRKK